MNTLKIKILLRFSRSIQREWNDSVSKVFSGNIVEYSATRDNDGRSCSLLLQWGRSLRVDAGWKERKGGTKARGSLVRLCEIKTCFTGAAFIATSTFPFVSLSQRDYSGFQSVQRIHSLPMAFSGIPRFPFFLFFFLLPWQLPSTLLPLICSGSAALYSSALFFSACRKTVASPLHFLKRSRTLGDSLIGSHRK